MIATATTSDDALALLLLCSSLGKLKAPGAPTPLGPKAWSELSQRIAASEWEGPGALLGRSASELQATLAFKKTESAERISELLARSGQLVVELERLAARGIWVTTRLDDRFPARLIERLGEQAPPLLFGSGPLDALTAPGVAIVGSRELDEPSRDFAQVLGARCASAGLTVLSGAARGADRVAMSAALDEGGIAVGVVAESLEEMVRRSSQPIREGQLTLLSPVSPDAGFSIGVAMGRNKLLYALADAAVVVSSGLDQGGTWAGATENLRHQWVPLFVRAGDSVPAGNRALIERGGVPLDDASLPAASGFLESLLARAPGELVPSQSEASVEIANGESTPAPRQTLETLPGVAGHPDDAFTRCWPLFDAFLSSPRSAKEIEGRFSSDLMSAQVRSWLKRAIDEGRATVDSKRRYRSTAHSPPALQPAML